MGVMKSGGGVGLELQATALILQGGPGTRAAVLTALVALVLCAIKCSGAFKFCCTSICDCKSTGSKPYTYQVHFPCCCANPRMCFHYMCTPW
jgi:hypothetical protein